jgi:hypothetical protein
VVPWTVFLEFLAVWALGYRVTPVMPLGSNDAQNGLAGEATLRSEDRDDHLSLRVE